MFRIREVAMSKRQVPPKSQRSKRASRCAKRVQRALAAKGRRESKAATRKFDSKGETRTKPGRRGPARKSFHDPHAAREAQRYENPIASREAILELLTEHGKPIEVEDIARALHIRDERSREALDKRLRAMLRDGQLLQNRVGELAPARKLDLIAGSVLANAEGYGFLRPDEGGEDLYLSPAQMRQVLHGDRVLASVVGVDRRGRRQGAIREVLERRASRLVGRVVEEHGVMVVAPDDRRLHQDVLIPPDARGGE